MMQSIPLTGTETLKAWEIVLLVLGMQSIPLTGTETFAGIQEGEELRMQSIPLTGTETSNTITPDTMPSDAIHTPHGD